jgi:hypothetical protein
VREDRYRAGVVQEANRVRDGKPLLGYERRTPRTEVPIERVPLIASPSGGDQRPGDVRPPDRSRAGFGHDRIYLKWDAKTVERRDHGVRSATAGAPELAQGRLERPQVFQMQSQQMDFVIVFHGTQFDTGNDGDSHFATGHGGLGEPVNCVVIGEPDDRESGDTGLRDQCSRRHAPI